MKLNFIIIVFFIGLVYINYFLLNDYSYATTTTTTSTTLQPNPEGLDLTEPLPECCDD